MTAHVQEHADITAPVTHHEQREANHLTGDHVARVRQLTRMSKTQWHSSKNPIEFTLVTLVTRIGPCQRAKNIP